MGRRQRKRGSYMGFLTAYVNVDLVLANEATGPGGARYI